MNKGRRIKKRLAIALIAAGLLILLSIGTAVYRVVKYGSEYKHIALSQATGSSTVIPARPGNIIDENGLFLTSTRKVFRLILDPKALYDTNERYDGSLDSTVKLLGETFGLNETALREAFTANPKSRYVRFKDCPILEQDQVDKYNEAVTAFTENRKKNNSDKSNPIITARIAGVWFEEEYRRSYPFNDALSKVIGYTTEDISEGILGLEKQYHSYLSGTDGKEYTYVDDEGNVTKEVTEPRNGFNIYTSLDINVSNLVQEEIRNFLENMDGGHRVNVLVMNPQNAEIIAMESDTEFDLNNPTDLTQLFTEEELEHPEDIFVLKEAYLTRPTVLENMTYEQRMTALLQAVQSNFQVSSAFEPGSTAKALTLATGIEDGSVQKTDSWTCTGSIRVDNFNIHCHSETLCGKLSPIEAIGRSCNVCLVQMANQIGVPTFVKYQERFNFGQKTNVDLPGEANTRNLLYRENNMHEVELATCSFGQGFNVTMVQMAAAYSSILNGGNYYEPHVVKKITDEEGNTIKEVTPVLARKTVSEETADYIKECLRYVVVKGTASGYLYHEGYDLGGKTGAAEKLPRGTGKYIVSFIGGAPIASPRFLLYVTVDEPYVEDQSSSLPAQMLASNIFKRLYAYYNVFSENGDDAYMYDWSGLRDFSDSSDSANGTPNIEDPNGEIPWIFGDDIE